MILAEERTTEEEKMHILEGSYNIERLISWIFTFFKFALSKRFSRRALYLQNVLVHIYMKCFPINVLSLTPFFWLNRMDFDFFLARSTLVSYLFQFFIILINRITIFMNTYQFNSHLLYYVISHSVFFVTVARAHMVHINIF